MDCGSLSLSNQLGVCSCPVCSLGTRDVRTTDVSACGLQIRNFLDPLTDNGSLVHEQLWIWSGLFLDWYLPVAYLLRYFILKNEQFRFCFSNTACILILQCLLMARRCFSLTYITRFWFLSFRSSFQCFLRGWPWPWSQPSVTFTIWSATQMSKRMSHRRIHCNPCKWY